MTTTTNMKELRQKSKAKNPPKMETKATQKQKLNLKADGQTGGRVMPRYLTPKTRLKRVCTLCSQDTKVLKVKGKTRDRERLKGEEV